ncbi:MAG: hypothetical protein HC888_11265 [Candidatus Competibacteraceae bacterium]|nr:hypothetical protein [Candidatus Competibacteraceae bacterium]
MDHLPVTIECAVNGVVAQVGCKRFVFENLDTCLQLLPRQSVNMAGAMGGTVLQARPEH